MLFTFFTIITFFFMEFVAWFTHKYVMHGFLWNLHEDHHTQNKPHPFFERNDSFFLIFATPAILLFLGTALFNIQILSAFALGITLYGLCYFIVHDIIIHQRFKWFSKSNNKYINAIKRAHKMHHKHLTKHDGECFGMLIVPYKYFKETFKK